MLLDGNVVIRLQLMLKILEPAGTQGNEPVTGSAVKKMGMGMGPAVVVPLRAFPGAGEGEGLHRPLLFKIVQSPVHRGQIIPLFHEHMDIPGAEGSFRLSDDLNQCFSRLRHISTSYYLPVTLPAAKAREKRRKLTMTIAAPVGRLRKNDAKIPITTDITAVVQAMNMVERKPEEI